MFRARSWSAAAQTSWKLSPRAANSATRSASRELGPAGGAIEDGCEQTCDAARSHASAAARCRRPASRHRRGRNPPRRTCAARARARSGRSSDPARCDEAPDRSASRSTRTLPAAAVSRASASSAGHGRSGLTWSGVTGDTPPQSLIPAAIRRASDPARRLGGAWMFIAAPNRMRAIAIVHRWSSRLGSRAAPCACRAWRGNSG